MKKEIIQKIEAYYKDVAKFALLEVDAEKTYKENKKHLESALEKRKEMIREKKEIEKRDGRYSMDIPTREEIIDGFMVGCCCACDAEETFQELDDEDKKEAMESNEYISCSPPSWNYDDPSEFSELEVFFKIIN